MALAREEMCTDLVVMQREMREGKKWTGRKSKVQRAGKEGEIGWVWWLMPCSPSTFGGGGRWIT